MVDINYFHVIGYMFSEGAEKSSEDQNGPTEDVHLQEARWLLQEATPALRAALLLALNTRLLSFPI